MDLFELTFINADLFQKKTPVIKRYIHVFIIPVKWIDSNEKTLFYYCIEQLLPIFL